MTLNYQVIVEGYPNLKEEVGGSNSGCESPLYLTENLPGGLYKILGKPRKVDLLSNPQHVKRKK